VTGRVWRGLGLAWLLALAASYVVWWTGAAPQLAPERELASVPVFDQGLPTGAMTRLVYRDLGPRDAPTIVLLHGSPGGLEVFDELAPLLSGKLRVLIPDLPGYGASGADLPDYSIAANALELRAWFDLLGLERVHLVGFSLGGGVALHLGQDDPGRVASVTLLSSLGVQELEWFGSYELNHGLHGLQLGLWQIVRWLTPHFGQADRARGYVRGFYDTDQRSLRGILEHWQQPLLIVHGERDFLVPPAAAREHHRLVPQSELLMLEDRSHFLPWTWTAPLAAVLLDFVSRVDAGQALTRADADPERVSAAQVPFDPADAPPFAGMALIGAMVMLALATLISEDLTCISAGLLVSQGRLEFLPATLACFLGIFIGDVGLYILGRMLGRPALRRAPLKWIVSEARVEQARAWFESRGVAVIFLSRFMPGLRLPTYVAAGVVGTRLSVFAFWFVLAGLLWTPAIVGLAAWIGMEAKDSLDLAGEYALPAMVGLVLSLVVVQRLLLPLGSWRGRRLSWGRLQRVWRWEFWPPWLFYAPVGLWIAWLALRHRSLALVTATNPAIPTGGFVGESKAAILSGLGQGNPRVARFELLRADGDPAVRRERAAAFLERHGLPVVLKPDVGQRGSGVRILHDREALELALGELAVDSLLQEFVPGPEFGVFYVRRPGEARGRIFSITEKLLPQVVGDGRSTLERLILSDRRAVCAASAYLDANAPRLQEVLPPGERLQLVEVGTHARGAIFLDGERYANEALLDAIDGLSQDYPGFFFGRYDLRVPSAEQLVRGEGLKVIELNGVTSEATHIYDPRHGLIQGWGTLFRQWSLAFEIAAANVAAGAQPSSVGEVWREWRAYRRAQRGHG
jgi:pimeloyl-ACP methyl ester carboxylesterase/membrane protein DedA with SNARE-associated domain